MLHHPAEQIRQALRSYVAERVESEPGEVMFETTLIRDGMYCGRRFELSGFSAVYFVEEKQIKLYSPAGNVERTSELETFVASSAPAQRFAA